MAFYLLQQSEPVVFRYDLVAAFLSFADVGEPYL